MDRHAGEARGDEEVAQTVQDLREELSKEDIKISKKRAYTGTVGRYLEGPSSSARSGSDLVNFDLTSTSTWIPVPLPRPWGNSTWAPQTPGGTRPRGTT